MSEYEHDNKPYEISISLPAFLGQSSTSAIIHFITSHPTWSKRAEYAGRPHSPRGDLVAGRTEHAERWSPLGTWEAGSGMLSQSNASKSSGKSEERGVCHCLLCQVDGVRLENSGLRADGWAAMQWRGARALETTDETGEKSGEGRVDYQ